MDAMHGHTEEHTLVAVYPRQEDARRRGSARKAHGVYTGTTGEWHAGSTLTSCIRESEWRAECTRAHAQKHMIVPCLSGRG